MGRAQRVQRQDPRCAAHRRAQIRSVVLSGGASAWQRRCSTRLPLFGLSWRSVVSCMGPAPSGGAAGGPITPRGEAVELSQDELKSQLQPGLRLLVTFPGDPGYFHERIVGAEVFPGHMMISTPHGHEYTEEAKNWGRIWLLSGAARYPKDLEGQVLAFEVPLDDPAMLRLVKRLREFALVERAARPGRRAGRDFAKCYGWEGAEMALPPRGFIDGVRRRLAGKRSGEPPASPTALLPIGEPEPPVPPPSMPPPGHRAVDLDPGSGQAWIVCEVTRETLSDGLDPSRWQIGNIVKLGDGSVVLGDRALFKDGSQVLSCARMAVGEVPSFVRRCRDTLLLVDPLPQPRVDVDLDAPAPGDLDGAALDDDDLRARLDLGKKGEEPAGAKLGGGRGTPDVPVVSTDFRVLPVDYDDQGVRYKPFRASVSESRDGSKYKDWPFQTEGVALNMMKHFERHGGNCLLWLDKWLTSKGLESSERTTIEMTVHMRTLHYLSSYDQLNIGAIAGAENVLLRVAQIVEAYRSDPRRPNWASVKHITATDDAMDPLPSSLRTYNAKLTKEEVEAENLRLRVRGLKPHGEDDASDGLPKFPGPKPSPKTPNPGPKGGLQAPKK